ncbi:hypothetical protein [Paenibacillus sp. Soil750]|uniref:hypothetical protein n=1 Tax=Paenibacillus sp. Soil750 TaxID=1736398 RepID=UPI0006F86AE1|nr:hypothetical protein [Paenibacillus sp. Soil750]KRE56818.1 hypothetical protein ASL11_34255 [Paenibacillus sp. Soil750]
MNKKVFYIVLTLIIIFSGCSSAPQTESRKDELEYGKTVRVTLAWNDTIYELVTESVPIDKIDKEIGVVNKQVSPYPTQNGEVGRNTPEGPMIIRNGGGKLYAIKDVSQQEQIVIELSKDEYRKCNFFTKLQ